MPLLVFGPEGIITAYSSWFVQIRNAAATVHEAEHPILISLAYTLSKRLGSETILVPSLSLAGTLLWLAAVMGCVLARQSRRRRVTGWDLAVDGGVLALAPVVVSPYLEPYHVVPALHPALALIRKAIAQSQSRRRRCGAAAALGASWVGLAVLAQLGVTGLGVYVQMLLIVSALACCRRAPPGAHSAPSASPPAVAPGDSPSSAACRQT
jgi:hypothetical protein